MTKQEKILLKDMEGGLYEYNKWYSIILLSISTISELWLSIRDRDLTKFIAFLIFVPTIIYLILK